VGARADHRSPNGHVSRVAEGVAQRRMRLVPAAPLRYGRRRMLDRQTDRHRPGHTQTHPSPGRRGPNPVLALQRSIGNRAVSQVLARDAVRTGSVQIAGIGEIKVKGGNLDLWAGHDTTDTVQVTSQKGKHSGKLKKLADARTMMPVKVKIDPAYQAGDQLNVGGGIALDIKSARIEKYSVADGEETWQIGHFEDVKRAKVVHLIGAG